MDPIGRSPISLPALVLGKLALVGCGLFVLVKAHYRDALLYDSLATQTLGEVLIAAGLIVAAVSIVQLGRSLSVGLPQAETELKTRGIYGLSRNPIYVGGFFMCIGSCLYALHPVNMFLFALTAGIHHAIVLKEERFLEARFGEQWRAYVQRVPRYIGNVSVGGDVRF